MRRGVVCGLLLYALMGCMAPERAVVTDVDPAGWRYAATVEYRNRDTASMQVLRLFLRLDDRFREDTLSVRVATLTPDSLRSEEVHRLVIHARPTPTSLQRVVEIPYRRKALLRQEGIYRFQITPTRGVEGVEAVGVKITNE